MIEVHNAGESTLMHFLRPADGRTRRVLNPASPQGFDLIVEPPPPELTEGRLDPALSMVLDGCMLMAPSARNQYPASVIGEVMLEDTPIGDVPYQLIRPECHRQDRAYLFTVSGRIRFSSIQGNGAGDEGHDDPGPEHEDLQGSLLDAPRG